MIAEHAHEKDENEANCCYKANEDDQVGTELHGEPEADEDHYRANDVYENCAHCYEDSVAAGHGFIAWHFTFELGFVTTKSSLIDVI